VPFYAYLNSYNLTINKSVFAIKKEERKEEFLFDKKTSKPLFYSPFSSFSKISFKENRKNADI
jgi:hypothetical protein